MPRDPLPNAPTIAMSDQTARETPMQKRPFLDPDHPMFAKAWVRWLVSVGPMLWAGFEFWQNQPMWGMIFAACGGYAFWTLIWNRK